VGGINRSHWGEDKRLEPPQRKALSGTGWPDSLPSGIADGLRKSLASANTFPRSKKCFATTLRDLQKHKVYDVVLGRSKAAMAAYLQRLEGKQDVGVVCMDLSSSYSAPVQKYLPNADNVSNRFHGIRLIGHYWIVGWHWTRSIISSRALLLCYGSKNRLKNGAEFLLRWCNEVALY